jgi:hypothetical protein
VGFYTAALQTRVISSGLPILVRQRSGAWVLEFSVRADAPEGPFSAADTLSVGRRREWETVSPPRSTAADLPW